MKSVIFIGVISLVISCVSSDNGLSMGINPMAQVGFCLSLCYLNHATFSLNRKMSLTKFNSNGDRTNQSSFSFLHCFLLSSKLQAGFVLRRCQLIRENHNKN